MAGSFGAGSGFEFSALTGAGGTLADLVVLHDVGIASDRGWLLTFCEDSATATVWRLVFNASKLLQDGYLGIVYWSGKLLEALQQIPGTRALTIVSHGLGGTVVKKAILTASASLRQHDQQFLNRLHAVLFTDDHVLYQVQARLILARHYAASWSADEKYLATKLLGVSRDFQIIQSVLQTEVSAFVSTNKEGICAADLDFISLGKACHVNRTGQSHKEVLEAKVLSSGDNTLVERLHDVIHSSVLNSARLRYRNRQSIVQRQPCIASLHYRALPDREHTIKPEEAATGTCSWILQHKSFIQWKRSEQQPLLWIHGAPGSGKTTLMKYLHQSLREHSFGHSPSDSLHAYYWFEPGRYSSQYPPFSDLYSTLLGQLLPHMHDTVVSDWMLDTKQSASQLCKSDSDRLGRLLQTLLNEISDSRTVCILLDGTDTIEKSHAQQIINFLRQITQRPRKYGIRICLSSRLPPLAPSGDYMIKIDKENHQGIAQFLQMELAGALSRQILKGSAVNSIIDTIRDRANGVFLWVVLVVRALHRDIDVGADVQTALEQMPNELADLYEKLWSRVVADDSKHHGYVVQAIAWLAFSFRALTVPELCAMVAYSGAFSCTVPRLAAQSEKAAMVEQRMQPNVQDLLVHSLGLIAISTSELETGHTTRLPSDRLVVHVRHHSILSKLRLLLSQHAYTLTAGVDATSYTEKKGESLMHFHLATSCIEYVKAAAKVTYSPDLSLVEFKQILPGFVYASSMWMHHVRAAKISLFSRHVFLSVFPLAQQSHLHDWSTLSRFRSCAVPRWMFEAPPILCVCSHYNLFDLAGVVLHTHESVSTFVLDVNDVDSRGLSAIAIASAAGNIGLVRKLLDFAPDAIMSDKKHGRKALPLAARIGSETIVKALLEAGADVNEAADGTPALLQCCTFGHYQVVKRLLFAGADPNACDVHSGRSALALAAAHKHLEIMSLLLSFGADVDQPNARTKLTPLHYAVLSRYLPAVEMLLKAGASPYAIKVGNDPSGVKQWLNRIVIMLSANQSCADAETMQCAQSDDTPPYDSGEVTGNRGRPSHRSGKLEKRQRSVSGNDGNQDDEHSGKRARETSNSGSSSKLRDPGNSACPYAKMVPQMYEARCNKPFKSITLLKTHLKEMHRNPECEECGKSGFAGKDGEQKLETHLMSRDCDRSESVPKDYSRGFYRYQGKLIDPPHRRKADDGHQVYVQKWQRICRILFSLGQDVEVPSPFYECPFAENRQLRLENERLREEVDRCRQLHMNMPSEPGQSGSTHNDLQHVARYPSGQSAQDEHSNPHRDPGPSQDDKPLLEYSQSPSPEILPPTTNIEYDSPAAWDYHLNCLVEDSAYGTLLQDADNLDSLFPPSPSGFEDATTINNHLPQSPFSALENTSHLALDALGQDHSLSEVLDTNSPAEATTGL